MISHKIVGSILKVVLLVLLASPAFAAVSTTPTLGPNDTPNSLSSHDYWLIRVQQEINLHLDQSRTYAASGNCEKSKTSFMAAVSLIAKYQIFDAPTVKQSMNTLAACYEAGSKVDMSTTAGEYAAQAIQAVANSDCVLAEKYLAQARAAIAAQRDGGSFQQATSAVMSATEKVGQSCPQGSATSVTQARVEALSKLQASITAAHNAQCAEAQKSAAAATDIIQLYSLQNDTAIVSSMSEANKAITACISQTSGLEKTRLEVTRLLLAAKASAEAGKCSEAESLFRTATSQYDNYRFMFQRDRTISTQRTAASTAISNCKMELSAIVSSALQYMQTSATASGAGRCADAQSSFSLAQGLINRYQLHNNTEIARATATAQTALGACGSGVVTY